MNILITGGAGYIGSHVVKQLSKNTATNVTVIDNLCGGTFDSISVLKKLYCDVNRFEFIQLDISNTQKLDVIFSLKKFDVIIHFAAHLQVGESTHKPLKYYLNNTVNTAQLVNLCIKYNVSKFVFSSTAAVYGEPEIVPIKESSPKAPINPYGTSKLMSETIIQDAARAHKHFQFVILRYFNVAGTDPEGIIGESHEPETHLIPLIIHAAIGKRDKILLFGDDYQTPDGSCIRDYVHVEDLASAHIQAIEYLKQNNSSNIFNCGYGVGYSVKQVIDTVKTISGINFKVEIVDRRTGDPAELIADNSKIINEMGWKPQYNDLNLICKSALDWEIKKHNE